MAQTLCLLFLGQLVSFNLAIISFSVSFNLVTKAYEYTSITSVTILDCWIIPLVIILTWLFLGTQYSSWQFLGAGVCLGALGLLLISDYKPGGMNPLFGVIAGIVFLSMSDVYTEFGVKKKDRVHVGNACEPLTDVFAFAGCTISSFAFDTRGSFLLKMSEATLFNLSLLTSDMWTVLIKIFIYKQQVKWLYYPAYALVAIGIFIYLKMGKDPDSAQAAEDANWCIDYSVLNEDSIHVRDDTVVQ